MNEIREKKPVNGNFWRGFSMGCVGVIISMTAFWFTWAKDLPQRSEVQTMINAAPFPYIEDKKLITNQLNNLHVDVKEIKTQVMENKLKLNTLLSKN